MLFQMGNQCLPHCSFKHFSEVAGKSHRSIVLGRTPTAPLVYWTDQDKQQIRGDQSLVQRSSPQYEKRFSKLYKLKPLNYQESQES